LTPRNSSRPRLIPSLGLLAVLALAVGTAGCGSGSSSSGPAPGTTAAGTPAAKQAGRPSDAGGATTRESTPGASIKEFGAPAGAAGKAAVVAAAHSFFTAMAGHDYTGLCSGLAAANRRQLRVLLKDQASGDCPSTLKRLLVPAAATEARRAADAAVTSVRVENGDAFVLFRPKGGVPSYFVMKSEGGAWKAISLAPGTPIDPTATP
jgi:hypothetical protein